jgi:hypothetical protein
MPNNPSTTSTSSSYSLHTYTKTFLLMLLLASSVISHPTQMGHPTVIEPDSFSRNEISPNPNMIRINDVQVGTHGTISPECNRYFWALTSPLYKVQLYFLQ